MRERYLSFLVIGVLSVIVFIFFFIQTQPIPVPKFLNSSTDASAPKTPTVTFVNPSKGATNPKLTIVEYSDFECIVCKQISPIIDIALQTYPNDVRLVWKDMPNDSAHLHATSAAIAAHCADRQGKFWEYAQMVFDRQSYLSDSALMQIAAELSLNQDKFAKCVSSKDTLPIVQKDFAEGQALGIAATPTLFVGDQVIIGLLTADELSAAIAKQLSGVAGSVSAGQTLKSNESSK